MGEGEWEEGGLERQILGIAPLREETDLLLMASVSLVSAPDAPARSIYDSPLAKFCSVMPARPIYFTLKISISVSLSHKFLHSTGPIKSAGSQG